MPRAKQVSGPQFCGGEGGEGFFSGLQFELYDLATDPKEKTNLAEKQEVISLLRMFVDEYDRWVNG